jgi:hypothetical protein
MDDFFKKLIEDKAEHLAFYFLINDFTYYDKLNTELLFEYFDVINESYTNCFKILLLKKLTLQNNSKDINNFAKLIIEFNNKNNIFKNNYGTEGHILDFFLDFNDNENDYIEQLTNYIKKFDQENFKEHVYTFEQFLNKIGCDLAIYQFIFTDNPLIKDFSDYKKMFQDCFRKAYEKFTKPTFFHKIEQIYKNERENKSATSKRLIKKKDNDKIKLLQQYFNIYKYPTKIRKDGGKIVYYNTIKLTFKIDKKFYSSNKDSEDIRYKKYLLEKFDISPIKTKTFDDYYNLFMKSSFNELNELENLSSNSQIKLFVLNLVKAVKISKILNNTDKIDNSIDIDGDLYTLETIINILTDIYKYLDEFKFKYLSDFNEKYNIEDTIKLLNFKRKELKNKKTRELSSITRSHYNEDELDKEIQKLEKYLKEKSNENNLETLIKKYFSVEKLLSLYFQKHDLTKHQLLSIIKKSQVKEQIIKQILDDDTKIYVKLYNLIQLSEHLLIRMFYNFTFIQQLSIENIKKIKLLLTQPLSEDTTERLQQIGRYRRGNLFTLSQEKSYSDFLKKVKKFQLLIMQTENKSVLASKSSIENEKNKKYKSKQLRMLTRKINVLVSNLSIKKNKKKEDKIKEDKIKEDKIKEDKIKEIEDEIKEIEDEIKKIEDEIKETEDEERRRKEKEEEEAIMKSNDEKPDESKALTIYNKFKFLNMIQELIKTKLNIKKYYYYNLITEIKLINHLSEYTFKSYNIRQMFMDKIKLITRIAKHLETQSSDKNKSTGLLLKN